MPIDEIDVEGLPREGKLQDDSDSEYDSEDESLAEALDVTLQVVNETDD